MTRVDDGFRASGPPADTRREVDRKVQKLAALARESGLRGIVLTTQHNFAWLTAGRSSRIDASRETGSVSLLVTADERRFLLANTIESPRYTEEILAGLDFDVIEFPWTEERADPTLPLREGERVAGGGPLGTDVLTSERPLLEARIARLRTTLDEDALPRYCQLGEVVGRTLGEVLRSTMPGTRESEIARNLTLGLHALDIRPVVLLVAADGRIAAHRHPTPTDLRWTRHLLVAVCGEQGGLIVSASRLVSVRTDDDLMARTRSTAAVFKALLESTSRGTSGAQLFETAAAAYSRVGFHGEELRHHQGGATGYRTREWVAHPKSGEVVAPPQAFAWNPTITGTKVEETCLLHSDDRLEVVTGSPAWPAIEVDVRGNTIAVPDVLVLGR